MDLSEFEKIEIEEFKGLYKRGMPDQTPQDHAICCENVAFYRGGQVATRPGLQADYKLNHPVKRIFEGAIDGVGLFVLTLDLAGNIYQNQNTTPIFSNVNMVDFVGINLFNKIFILPIVSVGPPPNLQVWKGIAATTRDAAGLKPVVGAMSAADGAAGNVDIGIYQIAVSYITDTGFTTPPAIMTGTYTAPGAKKIDVSSIPTGGPQVVARQLFITQANAKLFYYLGPSAGGLINDNTTTTATLDFFDTDLVLSADNLFDLLETIPGAIRTGGMNVYHNRLVLVRTDSDVIYLSYPEDPESMDNVVGFITDPQDSDAPQGALVLRDTLYITRAFSIYATQDNGDNPGTWSLTQIDGALGTSQFALGTIAATNTALNTGDVALIANLAGLFLFTGTIIRPELSWKIKDVWDQITRGAELNITLQLDFIKKVIYILLPTNGSQVPNVLLTCDYNDASFSSYGDPYLQVKWSMYSFPFNPLSIGLASFMDDIGDFNYYLWIGSPLDNYLFKLTEAQVGSDYGIMINSYYCCYLASSSKKGSITVFRHLNLRAQNQGNLYLELNSEDFDPTLTQVPVPLSSSLLPAKDKPRQINFMNEKMSVRFGVDLAHGSPGDNFTVDRLDIYCKSLFATRPQ